MGCIYVALNFGSSSPFLYLFSTGFCVNWVTARGSPFFSWPFTEHCLCVTNTRLNSIDEMETDLFQRCVQTKYRVSSFRFYISRSHIHIKCTLRCNFRMLRNKNFVFYIRQYSYQFNVHDFLAEYFCILFRRAFLLHWKQLGQNLFRIIFRKTMK